MAVGKRKRGRPPSGVVKRRLQCRVTQETWRTLSTMAFARVEPIGVIVDVLAQQWTREAGGGASSPKGKSPKCSG